MIIAQIESPTGVDNCEKIAAVPGVDVVFAAANDLASFSGHPQGTPGHEELLARINCATLKAGKHLGGSVEWLKRDNYLFFQMLSASTLIPRGVKDQLESIRNARDPA